MSQQAKVGSIWVSKNIFPRLRVKVCEINRVRAGNKTYTEIIYGLKNCKNGHITCTIQSFFDNYQLDK